MFSRAILILQNNTWTVSGEVPVIDVDINSRTVTIAGTTDVDGTLIIGSGTYNADGATDIKAVLYLLPTRYMMQIIPLLRRVEQSHFYRCCWIARWQYAVTDLGTLSAGAGTVEYDGGAQDVFADDYYNLVIDQSGDKTAQGTINVANDMTISNSVTFLTSVQTIDITGATTVSAILDIGNGQFNSRGGFSATGNINFSHNGGKLNFFTVSPPHLEH